jgi:hypothetical protein
MNFIVKYKVNFSKEKLNTVPHPTPHLLSVLNMCFSHMNKLAKYSMRVLKFQNFFLSFFLVGRGFELRASHPQSRCSTPLATPPAQDCLLIHWHWISCILWPVQVNDNIKAIWFIYTHCIHRYLNNNKNKQNIFFHNNCVPFIPSVMELCHDSS